MMKPVLFLPLLLVAAACSSASNCPPASPPSPPVASQCTAKGKTVIVVRHAEKASSDKDTPLSEKGQARAKQIATLLSNTNPTRLIATQYKRTQETIEPLATKAGKKVEVMPADKTKDLIADLKRAPEGSVIVVASHSNVVPAIVTELAPGTGLRALDEKQMLPEDDFARVYVVTQACGGATAIELSSDPG